MSSIYFVKILGKYKGEFLIFGKFSGHGAQGSMQFCPYLTTGSGGWRQLPECP